MKRLLVIPILLLRLVGIAVYLGATLAGNLLGVPVMGKLLGVLVILLMSVTAQAGDITGIPRVVDGDTLVIPKERIRLHGIDSPETRQTCTKVGKVWNCGRDATAALATRIGAQSVTCKGDKRDRYKRLIGVGLPHVRFHDLRHTHATQLLKQGVHPKVVSERLGHSKVSITLDTYSHVLPGMQEDAAEKIDLAMRLAIQGENDK
jgi:hypothetical protein